MKKLLSIVGLTIFLPAAAVAAPSGGLFDMVFEGAKDTYTTVYPGDAMTDYVLEALRTWRGTGIELTKDDLRAITEGRMTDVCGRDRLDASGRTITFVQSTCDELSNDILALLQSENEAVSLGRDLLAISNGAELSISDEPSRPMHMAHTTLLLRRVWSGAEGTGIIPWDEQHTPLVDALQTALKNDQSVQDTIRRFRHGLFRDAREADPALADIGNPVKDALRDLANALNITDDQRAVGEFAVPKLSGNIGFWARKDDVGLYWVYPMDFTSFALRPAGTYPAMRQYGERLAYPFAYTGDNAAANLLSPLCAHPTAREGYLCRPLPAVSPNCSSDGPSSDIVLTECDTVRSTHEFGPDVCKDFVNLYADDGTPLTVGEEHGGLNPDLRPANAAAVCTPETKTLLQDDIVSHACFIGHCLAQSFNGHTLIPNRNPVVVNESTSPYVACVRPDPALGVYAEVAQETPYPLPPYIGHELVMDFEQYYCGENGKTAHPVLGFCRYRDEDVARNPPSDQAQYARTIFGDAFTVGEGQDNLGEAATAIGFDAALQQSLEVNRKVFATLTGLVRQIADLLNELKRAPVTETACPWTGPFSSSSSST